MRRAARTDANHQAIVGQLRQLGYSVQSLAAVGHGCPDLLVGTRGLNFLLELKREAGNRGGTSHRTLTPEQVDWHAGWKGQVGVARTLDEALSQLRNPRQTRSG